MVPHLIRADGGIPEQSIISSPPQFGSAERRDLDARIMLRFLERPLSSGPYVGGGGKGR